MSKLPQHEWRDQVVALQNRMKSFIKNPGDDQLEAIISDMRKYVAANKASGIDARSTSSTQSED